MRRLFLKAVLTLVATTLMVSANAAEPAKSPALTGPHLVVADVTDAMMAVIKKGSAMLKEDPQKYYAEVRSILEPVVSFPLIAKNVMASYWPMATEAQREQFRETFTQSMVETLGKGMANFSDLKIATLPPTGDVSNQKKVEVVQEVQGPDGTSRLLYTLAQNKSGQWKLINVVLNGVNLGKSFRDQFVQAMRQNDNKIDKVIENWAQQG